MLKERSNDCAAWRSLPHKRNFMDQLVVAHHFDFHKNAVGIVGALVLTNSKRLSAARRSLVNDIKFIRWMLLEKITQHKLSLSFAVGLHFIVDRYVNSLIE